ncbi:Ger(x)C family spore germination protein [Paenibacillus albus]|uniref:Ger(X)C family spore germination protein n=1 Tax=Paenibacillus albus TaxID=2495582 RepID=A0A3Q8X7R0_9BACL|nr:Ger(x)C family spore germination protein [Paenibacillus albus]AZN40801.1 Ger(x)C family spore germination protein [Paenibacillus albus]
MKRVRLALSLVVLPLLLAGCWDRNEINEYAFWIGTALDLTENGQIKNSAQIAVPSQFISSKGQGTGGQRANIVISETGPSIISSMQKLQDKLPRKIFLGHRRAVFIGESLARKGLSDIMDQFTRNPDTRMRTDIFVVNGGEGKDALEINSPFNQFSAIAAVDQDRYCRLGDTALRDVLLDATSDGIRPSMPMIEISPSNQNEINKVFYVRSVAIFNKHMKMVGEIRDHASLNLYWIKGVMKDQYLTIQTDDGSYSFYESNLNRAIRTTMKDNKLKVTFKLTGEGRLLESTSKLDISYDTVLRSIEHKLNSIKKKEIEADIQFIQRNYGQDVFGIGEGVHREHPIRWKKMKGQWDEIFPTLDIAVEVDLHIQSLGKLGKPLPL